jgi:hypothetical protein
LLGEATRRHCRIERQFYREWCWIGAADRDPAADDEAVRGVQADRDGHDRPQRPVEEDVGSAVRGQRDRRQQLVTVDAVAVGGCDRRAAAQAKKMEARVAGHRRQGEVV